MSESRKIHEESKRTEKALEAKQAGEAKKSEEEQIRVLEAKMAAVNLVEQLFFSKKPSSFFEDPRCIPLISIERDINSRLKKLEDSKEIKQQEYREKIIIKIKEELEFFNPARIQYYALSNEHILKYYFSLLRVAASINDKDSLQTLLNYHLSGRQKFDINKCAYFERSDRFVCTPLLTLAAFHGHLDLVKWLVDERGADVNAVNLYGELALHFVVLGDSAPYHYHSLGHDHEGVAKFLIQKGGSNRQNNQERTPYDLASQPRRESSWLSLFTGAIPETTVGDIKFTASKVKPIFDELSLSALIPAAGSLRTSETNEGMLYLSLNKNEIHHITIEGDASSIQLSIHNKNETIIKEEISMEEFIFLVKEDRSFFEPFLTEKQLGIVFGYDRHIPGCRMQ
jgi:hypothetical protein